jgi:hypothetical protein
VTREVAGFRVSARTMAFAAVGLAMASYALVVGLEGTGQTLKADEWGYVIRGSNPLGEALFEPPGAKYLLAVPMLFYKGLFETVGIDTYLPYRVLGIVLVVVCAGLFFALARRRVGDLAAVPPTALLLFFGSAWDVVVTPLRVPALMSIAAGLGMLLSLERQDLRGDLAAAALLAISLASHPTSFAFVAAAVVIVLLRPSPERWQRSWVVLGPVVLYAGWWLWVRDPGLAASPEPGNVADIPVFVAESLVAVTAAITGLAGVFLEPGIMGLQAAVDSVLGWVAALVLVAAIGLALTRRSRPLPPTFWAILAALFTLWVATAVAHRDVEMRPAVSPRYLYPGGLLLLLLLAELSHGVRLPRAVPWIAGGILAIGLAYNVEQLHRSANGMRARSDEVKAYVGALELARGHVRPEFVAASRSIPSGQLTAGAYFEVADEFGSPAHSPADLARRPEPIRREADVVLAQALRLRAHPFSSGRPRDGPPPRVERVTQGESQADSGCARLRPSGGSVEAELALPPGGAWLRSKRIEDIALRVGRFANPPGYALTPSPGGSSAVIRIPRDGSPIPWRMLVSAPQAVTVCGLGS